MVSNRVSRSLLLAATAGAAALLATGCSGASQAGHGTQSAGAAANATPEQTIQLVAAHARLATSATATIAMQGTGAAAMTMSGTMDEQIRPQLLAVANFGTVRVAGQSLPGGLSEILTSKALYMRFSALGVLSGGKTWVEVPYSELSQATGGVNLGQIIQQAQNNSPLLQTQLLAGATGVRKVGTSTINGVPVTEYTGSYSMSAAIARMPASSRAALRQQTATAGIKSVDFDVWVDGQQQARKLVLTEHGSLENLTMTMLVTSINQPVTAQLPPASQTVTIPLSTLTAGN